MQVGAKCIEDMFVTSIIYDCGINFFFLEKTPLHNPVHDP
jgi:hypothetical protein